MYIYMYMHKYIYIYTPGQKYKTKFQNEEKYIVYKFLNHENQMYER